MEYPVTGQLPSLAEASKTSAEKNNLIDPFSAETNMFLEGVPTLAGEGAFAFVAITGQVLTEIFDPK